MEDGVLRGLVHLHPPRGGKGLGHLVLGADHGKIHHVPWIALQIAYPAGNIGIQLR